MSMTVTRKTRTRTSWCIAAIAVTALGAGCASGSSAPKPGATTLPQGSSASTPVDQTSSASQPGRSVDELTCEMFSKEALTASVNPALGSAEVQEVRTKLQEAGRLDCFGSFPPAVQGAMGIEFSVQDGYYNSGGFVTADTRPTVLADFQAERDKRAAKTFPADAPYVDTLFDAPEFGPDAYFLDTIYRENGGSDGGVRTELIVVRDTMPFVVVASITRGPTTEDGDLFTEPDARHELLASIANTLIGVIDS